MSAEILAVIILCELPAVIRLIHYHHTELIAGIQQDICRGAVAGTDGVTAHLLELLHLTVDRVTVSRCSQGTLIVMHTYTFQLRVHSV